MKFWHILSLPIAHCPLPAKHVRWGRAVVFFPTVASYQIHMWVLRSSRVYSVRTTRPSSPHPLGGKVATGALYLLPGSDTKFPMRQWPGTTRMIRGVEKRSVSGLCWLKSFPPRSGPRRYSQFHQRKTGNGEVQAKVGFSSKYNSFYQDKCDN